MKSLVIIILLLATFSAAADETIDIRFQDGVSGQVIVHTNNSLSSLQRQMIRNTAVFTIDKHTVKRESIRRLNMFKITAEIVVKRNQL